MKSPACRKVEREVQGSTRLTWACVIMWRDIREETFLPNHFNLYPYIWFWYKRLNRIQPTSDFIFNPCLNTWCIRFLLWKHILLLPFTKSDFGSWCQDLEYNTSSLFIIRISPSFKFQQILYYIYTWLMLGLYTQLSICSSTMPPA